MDKSAVVNCLLQVELFNNIEPSDIVLLAEFAKPACWSHPNDSPHGQGAQCHPEMSKELRGWVFSLEFERKPG